MPRSRNYFIPDRVFEVDSIFQNVAHEKLDRDVTGDTQYYRARVTSDLLRSDNGAGAVGEELNELNEIMFVQDPAGVCRDVEPDLDVFPSDHQDFLIGICGIQN